MPCSSEHLEPTAIEKETSKVLALLEEINEGEGLPDWYGTGHLENGDYAPRDKELLDQITADLCANLTEMADTVMDYSLEMQIWWRDHQRADARRREKERAIIPGDRQGKLVVMDLRVTTHKIDTVRGKIMQELPFLTEGEQNGLAAMQFRNSMDYLNSLGKGLFFFHQIKFDNGSFVEGFLLIRIF